VTTSQPTGSDRAGEYEGSYSKSAKFLVKKGALIDTTSVMSPVKFEEGVGTTAFRTGKRTKRSLSVRAQLDVKSAAKTARSGMVKAVIQFTGGML
jgi:hypothetical protein